MQKEENINSVASSSQGSVMNNFLKQIHNGIDSKRYPLFVKKMLAYIIT